MPIDPSYLARLQRLAADLDVDNRLYALVQLELLIGAGGPDALSLEPMLETAKGDRSPDVAARAVRIAARIASVRAKAQEDRLAARGLSEPAGRAFAAAPDGERIRAGLARRLTPWLERMGDHLREAGRDAEPRAVYALAAFGWAGSVPALEAAAVHPPLAHAALDALKAIGGERAQAAVRRLAATRTGETKLAALEALGRLGFSEPPPELFATTGTPAERKAVTRALSGIGGPVAVPLLIQALDDAEPEVLLEAVRGLGQIADPAFAASLARASYSRDSRVRATVASGLARIVVSAAEGCLRALLRDIDARVRANASDAFLCFHTDRATMRRFYATLLKDDHHRVRSNALVTLWPFNSKASYAALLKMIGSDAIVERSSAYWAAGKLGEEAAVRAMVRRLGTEDDHRGVEQGLVALEVLARPALMPWVRKTLSAPWPRIRLRACRVLTTVHDPAGAADLKKLAQTESDAKVLGAALRALAELAPAEAATMASGGDEAESAARAEAVVEGMLEADPALAAGHLAAFLDHPAPAVRARAIAATVRAGDLAALAHLERLAQSSPAAAMETIELIGRITGPSSLARAPALAAALARD